MNVLYPLTKGSELPEFKYNISRNRKACLISAPLDDASRSERARRLWAERKERWDAVKQARTRTMKRVSRSNELLDPCYGNLPGTVQPLFAGLCVASGPQEKQRSLPITFHHPTACSVTIINLHATPNPLLRLRTQSCHLVGVNTLLLNLVAAANWLSLALARRYAPQCVMLPRKYKDTWNGNASIWLDVCQNSAATHYSRDRPRHKHTCEICKRYMESIS